MDMGVALAAIGAALAVGLAGAGSSIGVSLAGKSATGVISEKPELFGRVRASSTARDSRYLWLPHCDFDFIKNWFTWW